MLNSIYNYFNFNRRERNGITFLIVIVFLLLLIDIFLPYFLRDESASIQIRRIEIEQPGMDYRKEKGKHFVFLAHHKAEYKLHPFDPNLMDEQEAMRLGIPKQVVATLLKFRSKGFKFRSAEDLKKVYGFRDSDYLRLKDFVRISDQSNQKPETQKALPTQYQENVVTTKRIVLDLNAADSLSLLSLPGIGPKLTARILKFRDALGGFYSVQQLKEVYGISDSLFSTLAGRIIVSNVAVRKINLNQIPADELKKHPYVKPQTAQVIINYRLKHGKFSSPNQLMETGAINEEWLKRMGPYLEI